MPEGVIVDVDIFRRVVVLPLREILFEALRGRGRAVGPVPRYEGAYGVPPLPVAFSGGKIVVPKIVKCRF